MTFWAAISQYYCVAYQLFFSIRTEQSCSIRTEQTDSINQVHILYKVKSYQSQSLCCHSSHLFRFWWLITKCHSYFLYSNNLNGILEWFICNRKEKYIQCIRWYRSTLQNTLSEIYIDFWGYYCSSSELFYCWRPWTFLCGENYRCCPLF